MLQYFIIQTLLYVICTYWGYRLSKRNKNRYFWMMVITFTLIEGLRFGRGVDYNLYINHWDNVKYGIYANSEAIVYNFMCYILQILDLPYQALIMLCSFILAYCGFKFLRRYRECLVLSVPLFILLTFSAECLFRWYTAFAFILLGLYYYLEGKQVWYWIFSLIGCGVHIMLIPIVLLLYIILVRGEKILLKPWPAVILMFLVTITWNPSNMLFLNNILHFILGDLEHYSGYLDTSKDILTGHWRGDEVARSILSYIRALLYSSFFILVGYRVIQKKPNLTFYYNILVIAAIIEPINSLEMIGRYVRMLLFFQCVLGCYCYLYVLKRYVKTGMIATLTAIVLMGYNCIQAIDYNYEPNKWRNMYIWDAGSLHSVPIEFWTD